MLSRISVPGVSAALLAALSILASPGAAHADGITTGSDDGGYHVAVNATVTGSGPHDPIPTGSISVSVPPQCWWEPTDFNTAFPGWDKVDLSKPKDFDNWYKKLVQGVSITFVPSRMAWPTVDQIKGAIRAMQAGEDVTWYHLGHADGVNCADEGFTESGGTYPPMWSTDGQAHTAEIEYAWFVGAPPPPMVNVEDLVKAVWDVADRNLESPDLDRSPKIVSTDDASLVNVPTWFWARNAADALAGDGEIHLHVAIPDTNVQADLDASTDGMSVSSADDSTTCTVDQAEQAYATGLDETAGCTLTFLRPNRAGWSVTASTTWTGTWHGTDHNGAHRGVLDAQTHATTVTVPVAEAQTVVTGTE